MPGVIHRVPDTNDALIKSIALRIHRKRKLDEKARNEEEAREMEKKRKEEEKRRRLEQQTKSLAAVKEELESLGAKLESLKKEKHRLFNELKVVCAKEKEEKEKETNTYLASQATSYPTHYPMNDSGKLSIMGSHKQVDKQLYGGYATTPRQAPRPAPATSSNPYLQQRPTPQPNRYMRLPASPAVNNP